MKTCSWAKPTPNDASLGYKSYRLYDRDDVARLQQVQALRKFGMALGDIGAYLDSPDASPLAIVEQQLASLDQQIEQAARMREQLMRLRAQLASGEAPELATWLTTLEQMTMYDKYFSQAELQQLPLIQNADAKKDWKELVAQVQSLMDQRIPSDGAAAKKLARRWIEILNRDTGDNPELAMKLDRMLTSEPRAQQETGISLEMRGYIMAAMGEVRLELWAKYLPPAAMEKMRRHHASGRVQEWGPLFEQIRTQMRADPSGRAPQSRDVARQKNGLFVEMVGSDPAIVPLFRKALESEPLLRAARGMTEEMVAWLHLVDSAA